MTEKELRERAEQRLKELFPEGVGINLFGCCSYEDSWEPGIKGWGGTDEESRNEGYVSVENWDKLFAVLLSREMENERLKEDNEHLKCLLRCDPEDRIDDGCGGVWSRTCPTCGLGTMHVNRPGEVQCDFCN